MKRITTAVTLAALLTLTACSGGNEDAEAETPLDFPNVEALDQHLADRFGGASELTGDDLTVMVESKNSELQDQDRTLKVLEDVGEGVKFDYDTLTVTAQTDNGSWGYRYDHDTVTEVAKAGPAEVVVTEIWDKADTGTNNAY